MQAGGAGGGSGGGGLGGLISGVGGLFSGILGGFFGSRGAKKQNKWNRMLAAENRQWQERMSNTAYQRATKDLEGAGLNRILALGSPSSTPAGNVARMENEGAAGIQGALALAQLTNTAAQTRATNAQAALTTAKRDVLGPAQEIAETLSGLLKNSKRGASDRPGTAQGGEGTLYEFLRGKATSAFEFLDPAGIQKGTALREAQRARDQKHWMEEPQRVQAQINQLQKQLEWGDENNIWNIDNKTSRNDILKKIRELQFKLKLMKGPKK